MCNGSIRVERLDAGLAEFRERGIELAAVQAHRAGDEIKFYGVADGGSSTGSIRARRTKYPFDFVAAGERSPTRLPPAAGLDIFGGDVIVSPCWRTDLDRSKRLAVVRALPGTGLLCHSGFHHEACPCRLKFKLRSQARTKALFDEEHQFIAPGLQTIALVVRAGDRARARARR